MWTVASVQTDSLGQDVINSWATSTRQSKMHYAERTMQNALRRTHYAERTMQNALCTMQNADWGFPWWPVYGLPDLEARNHLKPPMPFQAITFADNFTFHVISSAEYDICSRKESVMASLVNFLFSKNCRIKLGMLTVNWLIRKYLLLFSVFSHSENLFEFLAIELAVQTRTLCRWTRSKGDIWNVQMHC
jgi:hypothetical protein